MAITLDATLAAAQDLQNRKPLCRIVSKENVDPIPFVGELLSTATPDEQYPAAKVHSTGRIFVAFMVDGAGDTLRYGYTDPGRTYFTWVDFALGGSAVGEEVTFCEMADAYVGLIWEETSGGTRYVKYRKIAVTGVNLVPAVTGTILSQASSAFFTGPSVARLSDDSYLLAYGAMDGSDYKLHRRTSADFVTWAAAAEIPVAVLTSTSRKANPALLAFSTGTVWILFDYVDSVGPNSEELTNIYYMSSADKLATASNPAALTAYTDFAEKAEHPDAALNAAGLAYLAFDRLVASLRMDKDSTGWLGASSPISNMHIDTAAQKLYVISSTMGAGNKILICVAQIDLATWTIDKAWDTASVPAFPGYFTNTSGVYADSNRGDGVYVPVGHANGLVSVLNAQTDAITTYAFYDFSAYGIAKNVTWTPNTTRAMLIAKTWVDATTDRLYVAFYSGYLYDVCLQIGYIDLTAAGPDYTFTTIVSDVQTINAYTMAGFGGTYGFMEIVPSAGLIIVGLEGIASTWKGNLRIYDLATGGLWKNYTVDSNPSFPYRGLKRAVYNGGRVVGAITYEPLYGQGDYRGLCTIDTATDVVTYTRPPWASVNDYGLKDICLTDEGEYIIAANNYGVTLFDGTVWTLYDNNSLPGLTPSGEEAFANPVVYNPTTRTIIAGHGLSYAEVWSGLVMFSRDGYIKQSSYTIGTPNGSWSWSAAAPLVAGYTDYNASLAFDPDDDSLYAFWTNQNGTELSIKWGKALAEFDLSSYLVRGSPVERSSTLDPHTGNWDAELSFEVKEGHLFDPSNGVSLLRQYLAKGRKIEQQFGDKVGGTDYYETARHFTVSDDGELDYERGVYPVMKVECETPRRRWSQIHIVASPAYTATAAETIISALIQAYAGYAAGDIVLGTWGAAVVDFQAVDISLADCVNQLAYHCGYAIRDGAGGTIQAVKITDAGAVTRTYSDNTKLVRATPRNRNSSFVNRWTVRCEERTFTELLMAEELAAEMMATHCWNTGTKTYRVFYTQGSKIYRNPRLEVLSSVASIAFQLAGSCSESLMDNSHDEADQALWDTYCEIQVDSPDLTPAFIASLAALAASYWAPDVLNLTDELTIPIGKYAALTAIFLALNILAATGNFQYRIYGQPVIKVRRTVQESADDLDAQVKSGQTIAERPFDDPLCGSASECLAVAEFRRMVGMGERARWASGMVADLHNEEGDTISVIHPQSSQAVKIFLTDMKTEYVMPAGEGDDRGITQQFEGWRI